jgi:hypothetical protein
MRTENQGRLLLLLLLLFFSLMFDVCGGLVEGHNKQAIETRMRGDMAKEEDGGTPVTSSGVFGGGRGGKGASGGARDGTSAATSPRKASSSCTCR